MSRLSGGGGTYFDFLGLTSLYEAEFDADHESENRFALRCVISLLLGVLLLKKMTFFTKNSIFYAKVCFCHREMKVTFLKRYIQDEFSDTSFISLR